MREMVVNVFPAANDGCGIYRMALPALALKAQGADVEICDSQEVPRPCDVAIIQRPLRNPVLSVIDDFHAIGTAVVIDVDDDFDTVPRENLAWKGVQPSLVHDQDKANVHLACQKADLVTVTTPALAERYGYGHVLVIPNFIPQAFLGLKHFPFHEKPVVGWTGTVAAHPHDLQVPQGSVGRAVTNSGARFAVIGNPTEEELVARVIGVDRILGVGWKPFSEYPQALANFDVGVVPLSPTPFNEAKSYLKGLEMASLRVPFIASPTGPYRELAAQGIGELANNPKHWYRKTLRLINDSGFREQCGNDYRQKAHSFTVEANSFRWWEAWDTAYANFTRAFMSAGASR